MRIKKIIVALIILIGVTSCGESYIDRPSQTGPSTDNYYETAEQVRSATSTLYGLPWSGYENRAMDAIGDVMAGNEYTGGTDDPAFLNFTFSAASVRVQSAWSVFYKIGGWTSTLIQVLEDKKAKGGDAAVLDPGIAECHFFRGAVYFYIARIWDGAPIVTDPAAVAISGNFNIPRYFKADVLRFALEELQLAESGLPESDEPGRLTKYSAKGMMAKLYLYNATYFQVTEDYAKAKEKAAEVIQSKKYSLFPDYRAMFSSSEHNNNVESLFSIQHQLSGNPWGTASQKNPDRGPGNLQTDEASMWELYLPSLSILDEFEPGDKRRAGSVMEHGWSNLAWKPQKNDDQYNAFMANGYKYDTIQSADHGGEKNGTRSNIAKYVVGPGKKYGGEDVLGMNTGINTMMLRYADVLLIHAEAALAGGDEFGALASFNLVRLRAGLPLKASLTMDEIFKERRVEFAFEGDYWFDVQRRGYAKAKEIIESQDRGTVDAPNSVVFEEKDMHLPIPLGETLQDPALNGDAVAYY